MARPKIRVQHMVANATVRQYGTIPTSDLLGVAYRYIFPLDTEFPVTISQIDLFIRFFVHRPGAERFVVRLWWLSDDEDSAGVVEQYGPFPVKFPADRAVVDKPLRLKYVRVERPGRYALRLCRRKPIRWRGERWAVLASEYFTVERG